MCLLAMHYPHLNQLVYNEYYRVEYKLIIAYLMSYIIERKKNLYIAKKCRNGYNLYINTSFHDISNYLRPIFHI